MKMLQPVAPPTCSICHGVGNLFHASDSKYRYCNHCMSDARTALWELAPELADKNPFFIMLAAGKELTNWTNGWDSKSKTDIQRTEPNYQFWIQTRNGGSSYKTLHPPGTGEFSYESIIKTVDTQ